MIERPLPPFTERISQPGSRTPRLARGAVTFNSDQAFCAWVTGYDASKPTVTLGGEWGYLEGEEKLFKGCYAYDPPGTAHTPYATEQGMVVFASFHGPDPVFLDYLDEEGKVTGHMDLDWFRSYAST